jgi:ribosomal protein L11 methylase PrmA
LSLAALSYGAHFAWGCDTCTLAVDVARRNARANGLHHRSHFSQTTAARFSRPADLVLANLPPTALAELLRHPSLKAARWVISSGLLASHSLQLQENVPPEIEVAEVFVDGPWHTLLLTGRRL